ncbi:MAG TPA: class II aldolase/adducin family protein [Streptosporangiaceae bacterium]|nr:class II aldolase/adducin family protein [Streptosporangiaceae bacterium]
MAAERVDAAPRPEERGKAERVARADLASCGRDLLARGLLSQTSGNLSIRLGDEVLITPTSMEYDLIEPADIVVAGLDGVVRRGSRRPSSETPLHCLVYQTRPDISAIVHTHSPHATTLAVLGLPIPAVHYMIAVTGTTEIAVADYATYGTPELARNVRGAFAAPAKAALIANHGLVAGGSSLKEAASVAEAVETLAGLYYRALAIGKPVVLNDHQMAEVLVKYHAKDRQ